jgi:nucleoside-diphosphate-sugar epimerase
LEVPSAGGQRFLITAGDYDTQEIADVVRSALPQYASRIPVGEPGKRITGSHYTCSEKKSREVLGMRYRSLEDCVVPLAEQLYAIQNKEGYE